MTTMQTQLGVKDEVTYGTPVVVDRFFEYNSESMKADPRRVESNGLRAGRFVKRADRSEPYMGGVAGDVQFDVATKGFGWWLKHMLGAVSSGAPVDSNTEHTGTIANLLGKSFTMQGNRPFNPSGTSQPFTWHGCKITGWELACDVDGILVATMSIDAEDEDTVTALATASYPTDARVFTFMGASYTIGGVSAEVKSFKVSGKNNLDVDRRYQRGSALKKEPVENGFREYMWSAQLDWSDTTHYARFMASARANMYGAIVATFLGPIAHGGVTLPRLLVTMPACRFDADDVAVSGPEALLQDISGEAHNSNGTNDAITIAYRTTDATP